MTTPEVHQESIDCRELITKHFFAVTAVAFMQKSTRNYAIAYDSSLFRDYYEGIERAREEDVTDGVLSISK